MYGGLIMEREEQIQQAAEALEIKVISNPWTLFQKGAEWADQHPHWIPVEERLPKEQGKYMFRLSNGDMYYATYYPKLKLLDNVTHWMEIVPPRKEE